MFNGRGLRACHSSRRRKSQTESVGGVRTDSFDDWPGRSAEGGSEMTVEEIDQISARMQAEARGRLLDEKLAQLAEAQARTDEQIRLLIERSGGEAK
jgi:hypothetical protein